MMYTLVNQVEPVGLGIHRWGWPRVVRALRHFEQKDGVLLDDFAERSLLYPFSKRTEPFCTPWIGIFHVPATVHPVHPPGHFSHRRFESDLWVSSRQHLVAAISLSQHAATSYRAEISCPIHVLKHPMVKPRATFNIHTFLENRPRRLIQIGGHLRNVEAIHQAPPVPDYEYYELLPATPWADGYRKEVRSYWSKVRGRLTGRATIRSLHRLSPSEYDTLLQGVVVLCEFFDTSASNTVLECIMHNTPIMVNKHPALVEYLGSDYPLFFEDIEQISELLCDKKVAESHKYLCGLPKECFSLRSFIHGVLKVCKENR